MKKKKNKKEIDIQISDDGINENTSIENTEIDFLEVRKKRSIFPTLILFFVLLGFALIVAFNTFNIRDAYIYPALRNVPIIGSMIPYSDSSEFLAMTKEELIAEIERLEKENITLTEKNVDLQTRFEDRGVEISRLSSFAKSQEEFKKEKEEIDILIASENREKFIEYFESIYPENAEKIYKESIAGVALDKEKRKFINTFSSMDEESAARILEELILEDIDLVVEIIKNVDTETSAAILAEMKVANAAIVTKRVSPSNN